METIIKSSDNSTSFSCAINFGFFPNHKKGKIKKWIHTGRLAAITFNFSYMKMVGKKFIKN